MISSIFGFVKDDMREDYSIPDLRDKLFRCGALKSFQEVYNDYGEDADKIICYLILAYSIDSSFVTAGEDWLSTKKGIMELLGMDCEKFKQVLFFERQSVKEAIQYLSKEMRDWRYRQLIIWKESCQILDDIATTKPDSKNKSGAKNLGDANKFSYETKLKIADLETQIMQTTKSSGRLREVKEEGKKLESMESILRHLNEKDHKN